MWEFTYDNNIKLDEEDAEVVSGQQYMPMRARISQKYRGLYQFVSDYECPTRKSLYIDSSGKCEVYVIA